MNLNRAAEQDLVLIPGIGPKKAALIIGERNRRRGFSDFKQLEQLPELTGKDLELLRRFTKIENQESKP